MKNSSLSPPRQKNYQKAYELAYKLVSQQLTKVDDIELRCKRAGAEYSVRGSRQLITVEYLGQPYQISYPDIKVSLKGREGEVPIKDSILILHYLNLAKGAPPTNTMIDYKQLPEGINYYPTFHKRAIKPLISYFGSQPDMLLDMAKRLGGYKAEYGDTSVTINAFKYVPITFVLWQGDDEFAPEGSILFDANISDYLSTEDIHVLCENISWKLVRFLREGGNHSGEN